MILKHLWLDFGGTLYRETATFNAAHDDFRFQLYADVKGLSDLAVAKREYLEMYQRHGSNSAVFAALGKPSDYWMQALENLDFTKLIKPDRLAVQTLLTLKEMVPVSLFTNFKPQKIDTLLDHFHIPKACFTHVVSGDDIPHRKPALDGFYKMIELSGVPADQIMYVGDRVDVDIKPAKQLGMKTCLIYSGSNEADYCIENLAEIKRIVEKTHEGCH